MRYKKSPLTFLVDEEDIERIDYNDDTSFDDVISNRSSFIAANKIKNKHKKIRAKKKNLPFDLDEIEQAETVNYVDDTDVNDVRLNKNAKIAAKKIVDKRKRIGRKRRSEKNLQNL